MTSSTNHQRVLIAAYHFPPDPAVGALRVGRFARELPAFGWDPVVVTADARIDGPDAELLEGLDRVATIRVPDVELLRPWFRAIWKRRPGGGTGAVEADEGAATPRQRAALSRFVVSLCFLLPDEHKEWALRAALSAVRVIRRERVSCVVTSGPPASIHLIGLAARALTRAKWIADFRDPWIESLEARPPQARSRPADVLERCMEAAVVRCADRVFTTTEPLKRALGERYPARAARIVCVPNAIDPAAMTGARATVKFDRFTITYAGTLYEGRTPEPLFRAVSELIASGDLNEDEIRIRLVGHCSRVGGEETQALAGRWGLGQVVQISGVVPRRDAIATMQRSHLLLVLSPAWHRLIIPAKVFDYLGTGTPVLAIAAPGATADFVREIGGRSFDIDDVHGLKAFILASVRSTVDAGVAHDAGVQRYLSTVLTARVAAELSGVCASPAPLMGVMTS